MYKILDNKIVYILDNEIKGEVNQINRSGT